jgi:hypothetical protein
MITGRRQGEPRHRSEAVERRSGQSTRRPQWQQTYLTAAVISVQTEANRLSDTAALFMALGGGWPAACTTPVWRECAMGEMSAEQSAIRVPVAR